MPFTNSVTTPFPSIPIRLFSPWQQRPSSIVGDASQGFLVFNWLDPSCGDHDDERSDLCFVLDSF
jgi:hypothetical protein